MPGPPPIAFRRTRWDWSRPYVLGVVNVTPDSFSDGGRLPTVEAAVAHALRLVDEGADALDVGGESTRPGAAPISEASELGRVLPVLEALARVSPVPLSVDTTKHAVAEAALAAGAEILNDVGLGDAPERLGPIVARAGAVYIAMHARGTARTMAAQATYEDPAEEVPRELARRVAILHAQGVPRERIVLDPGLGFAKTASQSLRLLANLAPLRALGYAVCVGPSRKSFLAAGEAYRPAWTDPSAPPGERLGGTAAAVAAAVLQGAELLRVHDVAVMRQAARVAHALRLRAGAPEGGDA